MLFSKSYEQHIFFVNQGGKEIRFLCLVQIKETWLYLFFLKHLK